MKTKSRIEAVIDELIPPPPKKFFPIKFASDDFYPEAFGFERMRPDWDWASNYFGITWYGGKEWIWRIHRDPNGKFSLYHNYDDWHKKDRIRCDWPTSEQGAVIMALFGFKKWEPIKSPNKFNFHRVEL